MTAQETAEQERAEREAVTLSLVVPFFNEQEVVPLFFAKVVPVLESLAVTYEIVCVNDGSRDATLDKLLQAREAHPQVRILDLSRNFGKEAALTAGLDFSRGQAVVPIDADLQDPPELIAQMLEKWREGYEVVLACRSDRASDTPVKRATAEWFYHLHNRLCELKIPRNVGDYRLMDRTVVEALKTLPERQRFMKGLFAWVGFRTATVYYSRAVRAGGESKFNGWRLWNFALEGVTSFSTLPLRVWAYLGVLISLLAFVYGSVLVVKTIILGRDAPGYTSTIVSVLFLGGVILIGIGVLGEYIGRIYNEVKQRPVYIVRKKY